MYKTKLHKLKKNLHKIPDEFFVRSENGLEVIWLLDREDGTAGSYETSQERIGMTKSGEILWGYSSGCSCWTGWSSDDYCPTKSVKEFSLGDDFARTGDDEWRKSDVDDFGKEFLNTLDSLLLMVSDDVHPKEVLNIENAEIRRYMIKRIGYENIKDDVNAKVIHRDGDNELLVFENEEMYVKVKDSSTDREYLLFVEGNHETCSSAIAWTFGLSEEEYNPIIET